MMNQGGEFSSFGMNHPHHQMQNAHVVQDLVQDRVRDVGNLGLASDLIDVRNSDKWATGGINPIDCAIDCTVKALLRDQKYNRKTDEVIANLMSHGTHAPKINEHVENLENLAVDMSARGIGRDLMAVKRQQWLGRQQLQGLCTPFAPQLMGQQSGFSGLGCNPLTSMTGLGFGGYGQNAWNPAAGSRNVWQMVA